MNHAWKQYVAEMIGTGILTYMVLVSLDSPFSAYTPVIAGVTLCVLVYTLGHVSGTHINPAVTAGLWAMKKIGSADAMNYVIFQALGAVLASAVFKISFGGMPAITAGTSFGTFLSEAAGAALFLSGISAVVLKKTPENGSGLVIGSSLTLGILLASAGSNGVLNPAVALGIGSFSWAYVAGPVIGAILACLGYRWLVHRDPA